MVNPIPPSPEFCHGLRALEQAVSFQDEILGWIFVAAAWRSPSSPGKCWAQEQRSVVPPWVLLTLHRGKCKETWISHPAQPWLPEGSVNVDILPQPVPGRLCSLHSPFPSLPVGSQVGVYGVTPSLLSGGEPLPAQRSEVTLGKQRCKTCVRFQ